MNYLEYIKLFERNFEKIKSHLGWTVDKRISVRRQVDTLQREMRSFVISYVMNSCFYTNGDRMYSNTVCKRCGK
ncbi:hypothetical protein CD29_04395 [Ureibacillus manganicus DSM 26584]|uniref:Uncharacterized protein n=1 Tax=Ureibacillus manganicus DSM 26584 TaxID=1384049 RepID=A0A0A3I4Z7_9BACL|nr:hypothetical protein CD29_04395 [Ureibacillus manganicus DSM 26584]